MFHIDFSACDEYLGSFQHEAVMLTRETWHFRAEAASRWWFVSLGLFSALSLSSISAAAQTVDDWTARTFTVFKDEHYGNTERNTFDIILPGSSTTTPLVIYIHGGGFVQGDKAEAFRSRGEDISYFLRHKVAFASLNYRFYGPVDSMGVKVCLQDVRTALQFIRHYAVKYNINKKLIASYGSSAGAGSSLYLAFHDDFALKDDTTLLGESTRIGCAGAMAAQATYDVFRWELFIPGLDTVMEKMKEKFFDDAAHFYGYASYRAFAPQRDSITRSLDMLRMISPDDPPVFIMNLQKETAPTDMGIIQHHRAHALILSEYLQRNGIENEIYVYGNEIKSESDIPRPLREFLLRHLRQE